MMPTATQDIRFMTRALALAAKGLGWVEPNPMVGCVIVKNNRIIAEGFHQKFGGPHAEVDALRKAGARAKGATAYVTLEPCCHFGKTPPCTEAILAAGISRVVCAMVDPFPRVAGGGLKALRKRGVQVDVGVLEEEAAYLNRAFIKYVSRQQPWVIAKWAQSLDGAIATASGESQWISSEASRSMVHRLRARMDAILVGINTAIADDPRLTARVDGSPSGVIQRVATRVVLDTHCRLPTTSQLARTAKENPVVIYCAASQSRAEIARRKALQNRGIDVVPVGRDRHSGSLSISAVLRELHARSVTNVLVEGGPVVLASWLAAKQIDEAQIFVAPIIIPGQHGRRPFAGPDLKKLSLAPALRIRSVEKYDRDFRIIVHPA